MTRSSSRCALALVAAARVAHAPPGRSPRALAACRATPRPPCQPRYGAPCAIGFLLFRFASHAVSVVRRWRIKLASHTGLALAAGAVCVARGVFVRSAELFRFACSPPRPHATTLLAAGGGACPQPHGRSNRNPTQKLHGAKRSCLRIYRKANRASQIAQRQWDAK